MPVKPICHKFFSDALTRFNQARIKTLMLCADALISSDKLTLTDIGRHIHGKTQTKNKIKRVDRFLNNEALQKEQTHLYQAIAQPIIKTLPYLAIAVDWSGCCGTDYHILRASLLVDGRSVPLYNLIVEEENKETTQTHDYFLEQLSEVIDGHPNVYIISDGGFLTPFYQKVQQLNWHFIGRLRGTMVCKLEQQEKWQKLSELREGATSIPRYLGEAKLAKYSPSSCYGHLHLYHGEKKGRKGRSRFTKDDKMYRNLAKEPWLIVTSDKGLSPKQVIQLYKKRMQIEQNFRDDKSQRYGFSWRLSKTTGVKRISVLCLIACVATMALWLIGFEAEKRDWHKEFQANTVRERRVLSFLSLGKNVLIQYAGRVTTGYIRLCMKNFLLYYERYAVL